MTSVIQAQLITETPADNYAGNFTNNVAVDSSIILIATGACSTAVISSSAPKFNGASVTGAVQLWSILSATTGNATYTTAWLLPNVAGGAKGVGLTVANAADYGVGATGLYGIEADLGVGPTVISPASTGFSASGSGTADSGTTGAATAAGLAVAAICFYGSSLTAEGSPWTDLPLMDDGFSSGAYYLVSSGGTARYTATAGSAQWSAGAAIIVPGSGASAPQPLMAAGIF